MLSRPLVAYAAFLPAITIGAGDVTLVAPPAVVAAPALVAAQPNINCPSDNPPPHLDPAACDFGVDAPQVGGGPFQFSIPPGSDGGCRRDGAPNDAPSHILDAEGPEEIACEWTGVAGPSSDGYHRGRYSSTWDCYLDPVSQVPNEQMIGYTEELAEDGLVFRASCFPPPARSEQPENPTSPHDLGQWATGPHGAEPDPDAAIWNGLGELVVLEEVPPFDPPEPSLLDVWADAMDQLEMYGPDIHTAPPATSGGLVNLPVWLWTEQTDQTWPAEPLTAEAAGGPWTVEAWAEPQHIEWHMGDGGTLDTCGPGQPWEEEMGLGAIVDPPGGVCRYAYERPSRTEPDGTFEITAYTTWLVWWHINGEPDNEVEIQVGTTLTYPVNEVQVLTSR